MPVTLPRMPQSVRQALGPQAAEDFIQWFDVILVERAVRRDEYRELLSRLDILEHDVSDLKGGLAELHRTMDERFDRMQAQMDERFDRMQAQMNERFDRMNERFDQMYERITTMIRWTVGTLALLGTIMTILMAIAQFT